MRKQWIALIVGALIAGVLMVGCGDDDDGGASASANGGGTSAESTSDEGDAPGAITREDFIERANAVCVEHNNQVQAEARELYAEAEESNRTGEAIQVEAVETILIPGIQAQIDDLRALGAPTGDEVQVADIFASFQKVIDEAEANPQQIVKVKEPWGEARKLADAYGLTSCPFY